MSLPTYRVAIVGLGRIASLLEDDALREKPASHAGAVVANPRCELVAGMDVDPTRRATFAERWGVPNVFDSLASMIDDVKPDVLTVATHADSHRRCVVTALHMGVPVVVCEKPLAATIAEARKIARAARRAPASRVIVNHERRYSRDYKLVREAVCNGRFGRLISVKGTLFFGSKYPQRDVLRHDGTHLVDAINFVTNDRVSVRGRIGSLRRRVSSSYLHGRLSNSRVPVVVEVGSERSYLQFDIELSFSEGRIHLGNGRYTWEESFPSHHYGGFSSLLDLRRTIPEPTGYFAGMVADAVSCLDDPARRPVSGVEEALAAMRVIRSIPAIL